MRNTDRSGSICIGFTLFPAGLELDLSECIRNHSGAGIEGERKDRIWVYGV